MGEKRFRVLFRGEIAPGSEPAAVKAKLAGLFKTDVANIEKLFVGKPVVIKKDIDEQTAAKYRQALEKCGAVAIVQEMPVPAAAPAPQPEPKQEQAADAAPPAAVRCPKCGHVQESSNECGNCGVIISKYVAREQQQKQARAKSAEVLSVVHNYPSLLGFDAVYLTPEIPHDKLVAATTSLATLNPGEQPLLLIDATATGNAKNGLLLTDERLYGRNMGTPSEEISYGSIRTVEFKPGLLNMLLINGEEFVSLPVGIDTQAVVGMLKALSSLRPSAAERVTTAVRVARSTDIDQYIADIREMLDDGHWKQAQENLEALLLKNQDDWELHLLLARSHLLAGKLAVPEAATNHARIAAELGAPATPEVAEVISEILARDGRAAEGVTWLERAYEAIESSKEKEKFAKKIEEYRKAAGLGTCWQFFDRSGRPIFELSEIEVVRDKLISGELPPDATCRKNRLGKPLSLAEGIGKEEGKIELLFRPLAYHVKTGGLVVGWLIAIAAIVAAVIFAFTGGIGMIGEFFEETGLDWDGMNIWARGAFVATLIFVGLSVFRMNFGGLLLVFIVGSITTTILTQGSFSFDQLHAFMMLSVLGIPLFILFSILFLGIVAVVSFGAGYIVGMLVGALIGILRLPTLPKIKGAPAD